MAKSELEVLISCASFGGNSELRTLLVERDEDKGGVECGCVGGDDGEERT